LAVPTATWFTTEIERENRRPLDRRAPGAAYGATRKEAVARAKALALPILAERLERGEPTGKLGGLFEAA
jgi:hypothetical protein